MIQSYTDILNLPAGAKIRWPWFSEDEVLIIEKITKKRLIFRATRNSLGGEIPLARLLNYPKIGMFKLGQVVEAPMFLAEEVLNGKAQKIGREAY